MGGRDDMSPYRINKGVRLPKFGSPRNPFAPPAKTEVSPTCAEAAANACGEKTVVARAKADPDAAWKTSFQFRGGARAARWISEWRQKLNPLLQLPKRPGQVKSAAGPRFTKTPVQSELSLDKVQVVRNDLSDADFEVVTAKMPVGSQSEPSALLQHEVRSSGNTWDRVTARIFGVGQT
jgi:hypothetical protein